MNVSILGVILSYSSTRFAIGGNWRNVAAMSLYSFSHRQINLQWSQNQKVNLNNGSEAKHGNMLVFIKIVWWLYECLLYNCPYFLCLQFLYLKKQNKTCFKSSQVKCYLYSRLLSRLLLFLHESMGIESERKYLKSSAMLFIFIYTSSHNPHI